MKISLSPGPILILPNHNLVGTCGSCGGAVVSPMIWYGTTEPHRFCQDCGKQAKEKKKIPKFGQVIEML